MRVRRGGWKVVRADVSFTAYAIQSDPGTPDHEPAITKGGEQMGGSQYYEVLN